MKKREKQTFLIERLDPMGKGVSLPEGKVFFIPKTLPGEEVETWVANSSKGVNFCNPPKPEGILKKSGIRTTPDCEHYQFCNGCHFLHTDFDNEIELKKEIYKEQISRRLNWDAPETTFIKCDSRYNYRNRIQLHYSKPKKVLGLKQGKFITPVPNCLLPKSRIQEEVQNLYKNGAWQRIGKKKEGHIVIEQHGEVVSVKADGRYSGDTFSQVNEQMNSKLKELVKKHVEEIENNKLTLDLFGGSGNLSEDLSNKIEVISVDSHLGENPHGFELDLYSDDALEQLARHLDTRRPDVIILDPPRSGLKGLQEWLKKLKPRMFIYVSCNFQTQFRDLNDSNDLGYKITHSYQLDLFPGTHHFETVFVAVSD